MNRNWLWAGLIAIGLAYWWHTGQVRRAVDAAQLDARRDSVTLALRHHEALESVRAGVDAQRVQDSTRLADSLTGLRVRLARVGRQSDSMRLALVDLLADTTVSDTLRAVVLAVTDSLTVRAVTCETALGLADRLGNLCGLRLAARDSTVDALRGLLSVQTALTEAYRAQAHPGLLTRLRASFPFMAATGIVVLVLTR